MASTIYTPEEIERHAAEFKAANRRDHIRFVLGAVSISTALLAIVLLTFYFMQSWH